MTKHIRYTITELAKRYGVTTRSIRFYEEKGLLHPEREGQNRIYSESDRVRLQLILRGKRLGLTLEESRDIINMYMPGQRNEDQLQTLIQTIHAKRRQLKEQMEDLKRMLLDLDEAESKCLGALGDNAGQIPPQNKLRKENHR
ncbi:MerR family DNA-binding transcriptional regulator [Granulosicoccaceae sp. 1_MG-2023]|nr:MerR family DNA-binding transcriptional regulator [Granulosicoccaceae sp. 1_MG-2023]